MNLVYFYILCSSFCFAFLNFENPKIILLGIQKSGTTSFHHWFTQIGMKSAHFKVKEGNVAGLIFKAKIENKPLLTYLSNYDAITEINSARSVDEYFQCYYPQVQDMERMYNENPDALFILNTRNITEQFDSISRCVVLDLLLNNCGFLLPINGTVEERIAEFIETHNNNIRNFFSDKRNAKFIEFSLNDKNITSITKYINTKGIPFPWKNKNPKF